MDNLKEKTAQGLFWSAINSGMTQVLNLVIGIFLARLLSPEDYGIVGVLTVFTVIAGNLQSSGFTQGLINLKHPEANDYNSVFWFNILASLTIYAVLFFCAPLIAMFFHRPELTTLSRFVFLGFVISAFGIAQNAYMTKKMMNRQLATVSLAALIVSGTAGIAIAFSGYRYWSLAWQQIIYISVLNAGRYLYSDWRPSWHIDFTPVRRMFGFSVKILATNIINTVGNNILTLVFGRLFPMKAVGNFTQAYKWDTMANSVVSGALSQVSQTVLVSAADNGDRERRVFRKMMRFTAFLSFPVMFGLALVAEEFIVLTISDKWLGSVVLLRILCISGAFMPFYTLYQNLAISSGRSDIYMWLNIVQIVLQIGVILLFHPYGMTAMVVAYTVFFIIWLAVWQIYARRFIGLGFADTIRDIAPFMMTAAATMGITFMITKNMGSPAMVLPARIVIAAALYAGTMKMTKSEMLDECTAFIFRKKKRT